MSKAHRNRPPPQLRDCEPAHPHHDPDGARHLERKILDALQQLIEQGTKIMSKLSEIAAQVTDYAAGVSSDLDVINTKIDTLTATVTALQNSSGTVNAEDQGFIDQALAQLKDLKAKADAAAGREPPVVPTP